METAVLDGEPVYNEDGSMTFTMCNKYGGGGVCLYMNSDKEKIDLSDYTKVLIEVSAEESTPLSVSYYPDGTGFWCFITVVYLESEIVLPFITVPILNP